MNQFKNHCLSMNDLLKGSFALSIIFLTYQSPAFADWQEGAGYLQLDDKLDRPEDGYCLDVAGAGDWVDFNVPLNAHNCKLPGLYPDGAVTFDSPGPILFPAYKGCVTAAGLNGRSLPGAALMLKPCSGDINTGSAPFISESLQQFRHRSDGRIELNDTGLCIAVGAVSDRTFSPDHRWRALFMADCSAIDSVYSAWQAFQPQS